jgi:hypothetical protein
MYYTEDQDFSSSYDLAPPPPLFPSVSSADDTQEDRMRDNLLTGEGGWERAKSYDGEKA